VTKSTTRLLVLFLSAVCLATGAYGQLTPSADAYTNTAASSTNYGSNALEPGRSEWPSMESIFGWRMSGAAP
jgi:hypothetical protein